MKNKKQSEKLIFTINSRQTEHTCNKEIVKDNNTKNVLTKELIIDIAKILIKLNLEKDITFIQNKKPNQKPKNKNQSKLISQSSVLIWLDGFGLFALGCNKNE